MKLNVDLENHSYPIYIERNAIQKVHEYIPVSRKIAIITDTGVMIRTNVANISQTGRSTMGVKVMRLDQDAKIVTFTTVAAAEKEEVGTEIETEGEA